MYADHEKFLKWWAEPKPYATNKTHTTDATGEWHTYKIECSLPNPFKALEEIEQDMPDIDFDSYCTKLKINLGQNWSELMVAGQLTAASWQLGLSSPRLKITFRYPEKAPNFQENY